MSEVSLRQFAKTAQLDQGGNVRHDASGDGLRNKGQLGNKIAAFFNGIAMRIAGFSSGQIKQDKLERQQKTFDDFSRSLKGNYGETIRNDVLQGYDKDRPLKGRDITSIINNAHTQRQDNLQNNRTQVDKLTTDDAIHARFSESAKNNSSLWDKLPKSESGEGHEWIDVPNAFAKSVADRVAVETNYGRIPLKEGQAEQIAKEEMTKLVDILNKDQFHVHHGSYMRAGNAVGEMLQNIRDGRSPDTLNKSMQDAIRGCRDHLRLQGKEGTDKEVGDMIRMMVNRYGNYDTNKSKTDVSETPREMRDNKNSGVKKMRTTQTKALSSNSGLRKLYQRTMDKKTDPTKAKTEQTVMRSIVDGLGDQVGAMGRTKNNDRDQLALKR
jgi:hypothetical protein